MEESWKYLLWMELLKVGTRRIPGKNFQKQLHEEPKEELVEDCIVLWVLDHAY